MMLNKFLAILLSALLICTPAFSAEEGLTELDDVRVARKSANTFYSGEDDGNYYIWQPQGVIYQDTSTASEVWVVTSSDDNAVFPARSGYIRTEWPWRLWSADGKRLAFPALWNAGNITEGSEEAPWFVLRSDGTYMRPAAGSATRCLDIVPGIGRWFNWSPAEVDVAFQIGRDGNASCGQSGLDGNAVYKVTVADELVSNEPWVDVIGGDTTTNLYSYKRPITDDGKMMMLDATNGPGEPFKVVQIAPFGSKGLKKSFDIPSLGSYWSNLPADPGDNLHDQYFTGSEEASYWFHGFHSAGNHAMWRVRPTGVTGSALDWDASVDFTADDNQTAPYDWWGDTNELHSDKEAQIYWNTNSAPWDIDESVSHQDYDPWGAYMVGGCTESSASACVFSLGTDTYANVQEVGRASVGAWNLYCSWSAWTDYPMCDVSDGSVYSFHFDNASTDSRVVFQPHNTTHDGHDNGGLSPDGTKIAAYTDWLNPTQDIGDLIIAVARYPYPPEITAVAGTGSTVTVTFDWGTNGNRGYISRGWPNEDTDNPSPPRETEKFRLWRCQGTCTDSLGTWTPLAATDAEIHTRYDFTGNGWTGSDSWSISNDSVSNSVEYFYAVTSMEWSGLESHALSNIYSITLTGGSGTGSQSTAYPSDPGDTDDIGASEFYTSWNNANTSLIRYYNIYAQDGTTPTAVQSKLVASIPATSCVDGDCSWVDWLGDRGESTKYAVVAVDTQGNKSATTFVDNFDETSCENDDCSAAVATTPNADGQYLVQWDDMSTDLEDQEQPSEISLSVEGLIIK